MSLSSHVDIGFISPVDLYVMLGNAADNAIEATEKLSDTRKRVIGMTVGKKGAMVGFEISNYCDGEPIFENGLPVTSKSDKANHGFGMGSIKAVAEKYGGAISVSIADGIFTLQIGIPPAG